MSEIEYDEGQDEETEELITSEDQLSEPDHDDKAPAGPPTDEVE